ncbi:transcriptional regulator [Herbiconiux moechotypicola]|uniref:Transcriptional regulator n=1 Tax=Herbiconiux moechotypicola TaxID=637393 RepID=A0ABP5QRL1_9MICO|nr:transcriptional regulator [Herbiconiux moechotypicola]MCS5730929.1 transcriptional regulator [Herbiconiux moechotypicola]
MTGSSDSFDARVFYRDIKPYDAPRELDDLRGPNGGVVSLPVTVYWGPEHYFDLDNESDVIEAYQATLREGRASDQIALLNRELLVEVWPELLLPVRVRRLWEVRFPELTAA